MRSLATVQTISKIEPIEGADRIELVTVLGWHVVVKKGEFNVGDKCVYIEIDSLLPEKPEFEFLREKKFKIKTMKVRGVISQGICFPLSVVGLDESKYNVGDDVTEVIGVTKYDIGDDADLDSETSTKINSKLIKFLMRYKFFRKIFGKKKKKGDSFPTEYISKTDETRIQSMPWVLERDCGEYYYACEKIDGSSGSFLLVKNKFPHNIFGKKYEYIVASRNRIAPQDSSYTKVSEKYNVEKVLKSIAKEYNASMVAIQGEVIGDKIQGNKYKISGHQLHVFNLIIDGKLKNIRDMHVILDEYNMLIVPLVWEGQLNHTVDEVIEISKGKSFLAKRNREGLVFRKLSNPKVSFKAINPEFLLEEK